MSFSAQNSPGEMTHEMISDAQQLIFNPTGQEGTLASQAIAPISMLPVEDMSSSSNSNVESSQSHDSNHQKHAQPSPRPHPRSKPIHLRTASSSLQSQPTFAPISPETPIREQIRGGTDELDLSSLVTPPALRPPFPTPLQSAKHNQKQNTSVPDDGPSPFNEVNSGTEKSNTTSNTAHNTTTKLPSEDVSSPRAVGPTAPNSLDDLSPHSEGVGSAQLVDNTARNLINTSTTDVAREDGSSSGLAEIVTDNNEPQKDLELQTSVFGGDSTASTVRVTKGNIVYKLLCKDMTKQPQTEMMRYSWQPFEGLTVSEEDDDEARQSLAVIDVITGVEGFPITTRKSQHRVNFGTEADKDPAPFVIGEDFFARVTWPTNIRIFSPQLRSVLRSLIKYYPSLDLETKEMILIQPFSPLFHYWDDFQSILNAFRSGNSSTRIINPENGSDATIDCDQTTYDHLGVLLTSPPVIKEFTTVIGPERELHAKGFATYNNLWLLFRPGNTVFTLVRGQLAGFVVENSFHVSRQNSSSPSFLPNAMDRWSLKLWNLAYDNGKLTRQSYTFYINRYYGEKRITDLPVFPVALMNDNEAKKGALIQRGQRYHKIICDDQSHVRYNGLVISQKPYHYDGEIIIDHQSYLLESSGSPEMELLKISGTEPGDARGEPLFSKFNDMECSPVNPLTPTQYLLLPGHVFGFALGKKEWAIFDMNCVAELVHQEDIMKYLIIDKKSRNLLLSAAGSPRESTALKPWTSDWTADFIEGKGKGKVIFLHGSPGTGKTMTVECIAQWVKRPLMSLSAADLGTEEVKMEKRLVKWLDRAAMWGAIVLIDEAEVYLEQRQSGDLTRNALVTAFLRTMEYFPGLLFLTSNCIGLFDEAVMSRIHLSFSYERPGPEQRQEVWMGMFNKLKRDQEVAQKLAREQPNDPSRTNDSNGNPVASAKPFIEIDEGVKPLVYGKLKDLPLNGRDIRNIILIAIDVARRDAQNELKEGEKHPEKIIVLPEHIDLVVENRSVFARSYRAATGYDTDVMAANNNFRSVKGGASSLTDA